MAKYKNIIREKGFTQAAFADAMGITIPTISNWDNEITCPTINQLSLMGRVLDLDICELINYLQDEKYDG